MRLTKEQRHQLLDHQRPKIAGEGECPVKPGAVLHVAARVELHIDEIREPKGGGWSLRYTLIDRRDPVLKIRQTPGAHADSRDDFDADGFPRPLDQDEINRAALASAYTAGPTSLSGAGEAPHPREVDAVNDRRRQHRALWQREKQMILGSLGRLTADAETRLACGREVRALQRQLEAIDRKLRSAA